MGSFRNSTAFEGAGGRWELDCAGLSGTVGGLDESATRSAGPSQLLEAVLKDCEMTLEQPLALRDLNVGMSAPEGSVKLRISAPQPEPGMGQAILAIEADGAASWHFPAKSRSLQGANINVYEIPFHRPEPGKSRGMGELVGKILKPVIFPLMDPLIGPVGEFFIGKWEELRRPYAVRMFHPAGYKNKDCPPLKEADWAHLAAGRSLLFLHGTFSTAHGAFGDLPRETLARLHEHYGGRVFAFNHFTLTDDPQENVLRLLEMIPSGVKLDMDVVSHSRGGLVARVLQAEIHRQKLGHRVRRVVHVAVPNQGTQLAHPDHVVELINRYTSLFNLVPSLCGKDVLEAISCLVKVAAHGTLRGLKGLACMQPQGELYNWLNTPEHEQGVEYFGITADFKPQSRGFWGAVKRLATEEVDGVFAGAHNDLVVPTRGVFESNGSPGFPMPAHRLIQFGAEREVNHCNIFPQPETAAHLESWLMARDELVANAPAEKLSRPAEGGRRVALVIGNGSYALAPLKNPPHDAEALSGVLERLGFHSITRLQMADRKTMNQSVREFRNELRPGDVGLFFFAGHGVQFEGLNYLIPVNADIRHEEDVRDEALDAEVVLRAMQEQGCRLSIVLLDCCRDNPLPKRFRSGSRGLAVVNVPRDAFLAFATAPGETAADGSGQHSPFTQALLNWLPAAGLTIEAMIKRVMADVSQETGDEQRPWMQSNFHGDFCFCPQASDRQATESPEARDGDDWAATCEQNTTAAYRQFLNRWPRSSYRGKAEQKLKALAQEQADWEVASKTNTAEAYRRFADKWPSSRMVRTALHLIESELEHRDWDDACGAHQVDAYRRFLKNWPESTFREQATLLIRELELDGRKADEANQREKQDAERREKEETERRVKTDLERRSREEAVNREHEEQERRSREEAKLREKQDAERRTKEETERRSKEDLERRTRQEAVNREHEQQERRSRENAERREWEGVCESRSVDALRRFIQRRPGGPFAAAAAAKLKEWEAIAAPLPIPLRTEDPAQKPRFSPTQVRLRAIRGLIVSSLLLGGYAWILQNDHPGWAVVLGIPALSMVILILFSLWLLVTGREYQPAVQTLGAQPAKPARTPSAVRRHGCSIALVGLLFFVPSIGIKLYDASQHDSRYYSEHPEDQFVNLHPNWSATFGAFGIVGLLVLWFGLQAVVTGKELTDEPNNDG